MDLFRTPALLRIEFLVVTVVMTALTVLAQANPYSHTLPAATVRATDATLNGFATPNGLPSVAWFQWGEKGTYSATTSPVNVGNGTNVVFVTTAISNLMSGSAYQYRLVVSNAMGTTLGFEQSFGTGLKTLWWGWDGRPSTNLPAGLNNLVQVTQARWHSLALRGDGSFAIWGINNLYGQLNVPLDVTNVVTFGVGTYHTLAVMPDGTLRCWGRNNNNQCNPPPVGALIAAEGGTSHSIALRNNGAVIAWGGSTWGQASVPAGLQNVVAIAAGGGHNLALRHNGTVVAWGWNGYGQTSLPPGLSNVVAIEADDVHSVALRKDGTVVAWGGNYGQGIVPPGLSNVVGIDAAETHSLALRQDGSLVAWGNTTNVPGFSNVIAISSGGFANMALSPNQAPVGVSRLVQGPINEDVVIQLDGFDVNGDVIQFRVDSLPQKGTLYQYTNGERGSVIQSPNTLVDDLTRRVVFAPAPGQYGDDYASFSFVINDGETNSIPAAITIRIWGRPFAHTQMPRRLNQSGVTLSGLATPNRLATVAWFEWSTNGAPAQTTAPQSLGADSTTISVRQSLTGLLRGDFIRCRLVASNEAGLTRGQEKRFVMDGKVWGWGLTTAGQPPVPFGLSNVAAVAAGHLHNLAVQQDGRVVGWGNGQVDIPPDLTNAVLVAARGSGGHALREDGTLFSWNSYPDVPEGLSNIVDMSAGVVHSLALREDGTIETWGGYMIEEDVFVPAGLSNVVAVAAGGDHDLALKADGSVEVWGFNQYGVLNMPGQLSDVIAIAASSTHNLVVRSDGTVVGWGTWGRVNGVPVVIPPGLSNVVEVAAGESHSVALLADGTVVAFGLDQNNKTNVPAGLTQVVSIACGANHSLAISAVPPDPLFPTISGVIRNTNDLPVSGVVMQPSGGLPWVMTDVDGRYAVSAYSGWTGIVTPVLEGFMFLPGSLSYTNLSQPMTDQNYTLVSTIQPSIIGVVQSNSLVASWYGLRGVTYQPVFSTNLVNWEFLGTPIYGSNTIIGFTVPIDTRPRRFFKVGAAN